jgi:hypothetical protein
MLSIVLLLKQSRGAVMTLQDPRIGFCTPASFGLVAPIRSRSSQARRDTVFVLVAAAPSMGHDASSRPTK